MDNNVNAIRLVDVFIKMENDTHTMCRAWLVVQSLEDDTLSHVVNSMIEFQFMCDTMNFLRVYGELFHAIDVNHWKNMGISQVSTDYINKYYIKLEGVKAPLTRAEYDDFK